MYLINQHEIKNSILCFYFAQTVSMTHFIYIGKKRFQQETTIKVLTKWKFVCSQMAYGKVKFDLRAEDCLE